MICEMFWCVVGFGFSMTEVGKKLKNKIRNINFIEKQKIVQFEDGKFAIRAKIFGTALYRNLVNPGTNDPFVRWCTRNDIHFEYKCKTENKSLCEEALNKNSDNEVVVDK